MQYYTADFATHESELFPQTTAKNLLEASSIPNYSFCDSKRTQAEIENRAQFYTILH
jgi:hypothetical protein